MWNGWDCRSMGDGRSTLADEEKHYFEETKFRKEYKYLKRKFSNLIYENEAFMQALRSAQRQLLQITRDKTFLLDRLSMHEKLDKSTSESEETESSDDGEVQKPEPTRKRKSEPNTHNNNTNSVQTHETSGKKIPPAKRKRPPPKSANKQITQQAMVHPPGGTTTSATVSNILTADGHMTPEEVERHLQSQSYLEFVPERAPPTVPTEMFSNEPSLDSESNDVAELETSPSNMGEELSTDMVPDN